MRRQRGFTLIELLIVMAIIAAMAAGVMVLIPVMRGKARANETRALLSQVDAVIAIDVFHEYVRSGIERIEELLAGLRRRFAGATLIVAEFCRQPQERLRRHPSAFLEHHLFHILSHQIILEADQWRRVFQRAGWRIVEEQIYDMVGHGYFVLE